MQLITNKISTGKPGRFEDFIKKFKASQVKTASVKTAEEQDEAASSGQLKVEPLHQTGESTTMPKNGPSAKKDDGEKAAASGSSSGKDTDKDEADSSGNPEWEGKKQNNNDPDQDQKDEDVKTAAADTCGECGCQTGKCKCDEPCKACMAKAKATEKTAGELPEALKEHMFKKKDDKDDGGETKPATDSDDDTDAEASSKDEDKEEKEASAKCKDCDCDPCTCKDKEASKAPKFVKWANLDSKNKSFLTTYWKQLFGDDYVNALVSDK
jgi:hypothetical protein